MHLIVYEVVELQVVHYTNSNSVLEWLTCTSIVKDCLTIAVDSCKLECFVLLKLAP